MAGKTRKIVPKRIGNVKVPKRLRKTVNKALSNPKTAEMASGALLAIGAALARKTLGDKAARHGFASAGEDRPQEGRPADPLADIGTLVAGAAGEALRGMTGAVTRIVEEAVDTLRRDFGHGAEPDDARAEDAGRGDAGAGATRNVRPFPGRNAEAGAQSEPAAPAEPDARLDGSESFGDHDDNDDPLDGNREDKPGPMTGAGP